MGWRGGGGGGGVGRERESQQATTRGGPADAGSMDCAAFAPGHGVVKRLVGYSFFYTCPPN